MPIYGAPCSDAGADDGFEGEPGSRTAARPRSPPGLESRPRQWLVLERGERRLVLFRGWPEPELVDAFRQMSTTIGLALEAPDLAAPGGFEGWGYVFIGGSHRKEASFADALRDLRLAGWIVDRDAVWPMISGSYRPRMLDLLPLPLPEEAIARDPDLATAWPPERMEA